MAQEFSRAQRVGEQIKREVAQLIRSESDDPRLTMVSITSIDLARDLAHAKLYVTLLGDVAERVEVIAALNRMGPLLRKRLGRALHIRNVPNLQFFYDDVVEKGAELSNLISRTVAADAAKHNSDGSDNGGGSDQ